MSTLTSRQINYRFLAVIIVVILMGMYVAKHDKQVQVSEADKRVLDCLPEDQGVRTVMWLESQDQGLTLHCEKHAIDTYGSVSKSKPYTLSFLVPVSVE